MRTADRSPGTDHSDTMPLITSSTPSIFDEPTQPQAHLTTPSGDGSPLHLQHVEFGAPSAPPAAVAVTRNEASQTGINHSLSRSDEQSEGNVSPVEELVLQLKSWHNVLCYCDMTVECAELQKCVQNYCGGLWRDFSNLIGLSYTSSTAH